MGEQVFNINFVRTVRRYPCVYDHGRLDYCLRHVTEAAWTDISKEVGEDVKTCKEKWKNLRTVFRRNLLKDGGTTKRPYYLNEHMQFMIPLLHGAKKRGGRSWYQGGGGTTEGCTGTAMEDYEREASWEDYSIGDEEDEDGYMQEDEDPLQMVETVIKKEPEPCGSRKSEERPSTTQVKSEPELDIRRESKKKPEETNWLSVKPFQSMQYQQMAVEELRKRAAAAVAAAGEDEDPEPETSSEPISGRKRIKTERRESKTWTLADQDTGRTLQDTGRTHQDCPDTQFLLSLKPDLEQMNPRQKRKFKKEIFNLLDSILDTQAGESTQSSLNLPSSTSRYLHKK